MRLANLVMWASLSVGSFWGMACAGSSEQVRSDLISVDVPWWKKLVWTEKHDADTKIMVAGRTGNASLDEGMAMDNATQDAREQLALYLDATTTAFRERLRKMISAAGKKADTDAKGGAEKTETNLAGGRTIAEGTVRGMEVINSRTDEATDTLYVLGQLDVTALRAALATSAALSEEERERIKADSAEVRDAMNQALDEAKAAKR